MQVGVVEEHGREAPQLGRPRPAGDLVVVELGQLLRERRQLAVLVDLTLPAVGHRAGEAGPGDLRNRVGETPGQGLGQAVLRTVGAPFGHQRLEVVGGDVDLGPHAVARAAQRGDLERGHVADRGARLEPARQRDHGHAVLACQLGEAPAGGGHHPRRPDDAGRLVARQRLLRVARVGGAEHHRVGRRPARQLVGARDGDGPRGAVAERGARQRPADRRAPHAGHDQSPRCVPGLEPGALDAIRRVVEMLGQPQDVLHLAAAIDGVHGRPVQRRGGCLGQNLMAPSGSDTPGKIRAPWVRMLSDPTVTPSPSTVPSSMCVLAPIRAPAPRMQ